MESELLTLPEAARLLRLKVSTLRSWRLNKRIIGFRKLGRKVFVHREDVERLIQRSLEPAKAVR